MKRFILFITLLVFSFIAFAQVNGSFNYGQDGHVYFYLVNNTRFHVPVTVIARNAQKNQSRRDQVTVWSGNTFFFGPNYNWAWEKGETMTVIDGNGQSANWVCPYTDPDVLNMDSGHSSTNGYNGNYSQQSIQCYACHGSGRCQACNGSGTQYAYGMIRACSLCQGKGYCTQCGGKGRTVNPYNNPGTISTPRKNNDQANNNRIQTKPSNGNNVTSNTLRSNCTAVTKENKNGTILYKTTGKDRFRFYGVHQKTPMSGISQEYIITPSLYLMKESSQNTYMFVLEIMFGAAVGDKKYTENFIGKPGDKFLLECGNLMVYGQGTGTVPQKIVFELQDYHFSKIPNMGGKEAKITNARTGQVIFLGSWSIGDIDTYSTRVKECISTMYNLLKTSAK